MQEFLLLFIAVMLLILAVELSMVLYYAIIFIQHAITIIERIKALELSFEEKTAMLEHELTIAGGKIIKGIVKKAGNFLK